MSQVELVFDQPSAVGESPLWDATLGALWWVDIVNKTIHRLIVSTQQHHSWVLPEMVGSIARRTDGHWIAALESAIAHVELPESQDARIVEHFAVDHRASDMRCNDGRCDRAGRFIVSTMYKDMSAGKSVGVLLKLDVEHVNRFFDQSFIVGNGLAFSSAGDKMYFSDSHPSIQTVWVGEYSSESGLVHSPRVFADFKQLDGRPDGAAIDIDDCYWICANDGSAVYRFTPEGKLDRKISLPIKKPSMCAFGGANYDTLFITSIRPEGIDLTDQPLAGCVFALNPGTQGHEEPQFRVAKAAR
jgi:sugar lactone lactonase YvrE